MFASLVQKYAAAFLTGLILALAVWVALPSMVVSMDDDFWYLRSTIETIQKGRPWTDQWLTPWGASTTGIAALVYRISGSFTLAVHLPLALYAGLAAWALAAMLRGAGISRLMSSGTTLLVLLSPTVFFMFINFTGVAIYMAGLWWCLHFARLRRWGWFFVPWVFALASRQSAVVWLALPGWALVMEIWRGRRAALHSREARSLAALLAAACLAFLAIKSFMNPTAGQKSILAGISVASWDRIRAPLVSGILMIFAGRAIASTACLLGRTETREQSIPLWRWLTAPLLAAAGAFGARFFLSETVQTHGCYSDDFSSIAAPVLGGLLGLALALRPGHWRPDCLFAALGSIALLCLYSAKNDYYFVDALFFGLASALPDAGKTDSAPAGKRMLWRPLALACLILLGCGYWVGRGYVRQVTDQDRAAAIITLYEKAIDEDKVQPWQVGLAPFGYQGWVFQEYYTRNTPLPSIGGFIPLVDGWDGKSGSGVITQYHKSLRSWRDLIPTRNNITLRDSKDATTILEIHYPVLTSRPATFTLKGKPASPARVDPAKFTRIPFPTSDAGWDKLIAESRFSE